MEKQEFSTEVLQTCENMIKANITRCTVMIDFLKKKIAIMEQKKAALNSKSSEAEVEFVENKLDSLNHSLSKWKEHLENFQSKTPEKLATELLTNKNKSHENVEHYKSVSLKALTITEEELNNLPPQEKQHISEVKEEFESDIFEQALNILHIKEENASLPKNRDKIIKKCEELKAEEIEYYNNAIKNEQETIDMSLEQYVEKQYAWVQRALTFDIGEVREFSLVEAMGLQHASLAMEEHGFRKNSVDLHSEQVERIAELSEEEFESMKAILTANKEQYQKMQAKTEKLNKFDKWFMNLIEKITKVTPITTLAGFGVTIAGFALGGKEVVSETTAAVISYSGVAVGTLSLGTLISILPAAIAEKIVDALTKNANVEAEKAVENYLKGLPIKTNTQGLELEAH